MINRIDIPFIFEHENLVFQISWHIKVCFYRDFWTVFSGDAESFASRCNATAVLVLAEIGKCRSKTNPMPGCIGLGLSYERVHLSAEWTVMAFGEMCHYMWPVHNFVSL